MVTETYEQGPLIYFDCQVGTSAGVAAITSPQCLRAHQWASDEHSSRHVGSLWCHRQEQQHCVTANAPCSPLAAADHQITSGMLLQLHNIAPNTGAASRAVYSGWCPRVSRPDFIFDYQYM